MSRRGEGGLGWNGMQGIFAVGVDIKIFWTEEDT